MFDQLTSNPVALLVTLALVVLIVLFLIYYTNKRRQDIKQEELRNSQKPQDSVKLTQGLIQQSYNATSQREDSVKRIEQLIEESKADKPLFESLEEKLKKTYYFHSKPFDNAYRYSAAGRYVKVEGEELKDFPSGYKLVIAYAIVGPGDRFSRAKGRKIAEGFLANPKKQYEFPVAEEDIQTPGGTFGFFAKTHVPFLVLTPKDRHATRLEYSNPENWIPNPTVNPTEEGKTRHENYLQAIKTKPHELLVAQIEVSFCEFCEVYELEVVGVQPMIETEVPQVETPTSEFPQVEESSVPTQEVASEEIEVKVSDSSQSDKEEDTPHTEQSI